ncbi:hypothetical protein EMIHUDRAFT_222101 [Emiliania huxleyi CCMP1516]|uniref:Uncharacterized protein n=2 Tax=Emiliania huxleyi TaxID=2903 RepID=A0A0D3KZ54_EMIH1|nr:hypothetical protein EMIHUDRAFT_222101 [Emiliania huxleyi CCMP1516]EOD41039.1 hypothetical protein EMIHUDRAFT_222101 [Emiliania huxleyi CCMP1516]|eukprot:XP_005793468.1 hypothetical protein EMIHUDRAFT_222101 [Emiliania huxleyi CCMP1516]
MAGARNESARRGRLCGPMGRNGADFEDRLLTPPFPAAPEERGTRRAGHCTVPGAKLCGEKDGEAFDGLRNATHLDWQVTYTHRPPRRQ